jgi:hypothetical protein
MIHNHQQVNLAFVADDMVCKPEFAARFFDELNNQMGNSPVQRHNFALRVAACVDPETLKLFVQLGIEAMKVRKR